MRILLLNYEFPPLGGGAGNATKNIAKEMSLQGHDVLVLTTWFNGLSETENIDGYKILRLKSRRKKLDSSNVLEMFHYVFLAILKIKKIILDFKPEVTISFFAIPTGLVSLYIKFMYKIPFVISLRGGDVPGFLPISLKYHHIISKPFTNLVWNNASAIVANSIGLKKLADKTSIKFRKNTEYIPNGVDGLKFKYDTNKKQDELNILFAGRLVKQKGVIFLIEAIDKIIKSNLETNNKLNCKIVGDGPLKSELESEVNKRGLGGYIKFIGWVDKDKTPEYFNWANLFVLPSYEEGMPNVLLEAISSGLAIVATRISGNDELVDDGVNGFLYSNHDDLSGIINRFLDDRDLKYKFGLESVKKSKNFSWNKVAKEYIDICQKII